MNIPTTLPNRLNEQHRQSIRDLFVELEILPISCLLYEADEYRVISKNRQIPDDFIYIPRRNRLICKVEDEVREIGPGEFMMVTAGKRHGAVMADGVENYEVFALHMHAIDGYGHRIFDRFGSPFGVFTDQDMWFDKLATCTHLMGRVAPSATVFFQQLVTWLLYEQLLKANPLREAIEKMDERISRLLSLVRTTLDRDWTVVEMARECYLSPSRFRELFSQNTGVSPKKYVQQLRLTHARSLLATEPDLSVEEIANRVGISDAHYFHAIYKAMFDETPKKTQRSGDFPLEH